MGICESKRNTTVTTGSTQENIHNEKPEPIPENYPINTPQTIDDESIESDFEKPFIDFPPNTAKVLSYLICRISLESHGQKIIGTGFILGFMIDLEGFICLMTNAHVINNESVNNNNIIDITFEAFEGIKTEKIKLDRNVRYIHCFRNEGFDITVVEILDEDNISKRSFLEPKLDISIDNSLINNEIYYPQYITEEKIFKEGEGIKII